MPKSDSKNAKRLLKLDEMRKKEMIANFEF